MQQAHDPGRLRWAVYWMLIAVSVGGMVGRILAVDSVDRLGQQNQLAARGDPRNIMRPFLSANDRSRWCTIRSLVEFGTYEIDDVIFVPDTLPADDSFHVPPGADSRRYRAPDACPVEEPLWDTIDKVRHRNADGQLRFYSSKPPLLATLLAGEYWLIHQVTGATLKDHPHEIARFMLITVNVLPLAVMFVLLARLVERLGTTDWGRMFVMAAATLGTLLTTFAVTLNNHLPAAVCAAAALYLAVRIWCDGERRLRYLAAAGFFAAFTAANELPALAFFAALGAALLWKAPRPTLVAFVPAALLVAAAFFGTNKIAHDRWSPPYAQRQRPSADDNWYEYEYYVQGAKGPELVPSYWYPQEKRGIDRGEEDRAAYAFHVLAGHHGVFSITPVWLLCLTGLWLVCRPRTWRWGWPSQSTDTLGVEAAPTDGTAEVHAPGAPCLAVGGRTDSPSYLRELSLFVAAITTVCLVFYLLRPLEDRNYGGVAAGFRWMFWFAPLWLLVMLPAADRMAPSRRWRIVGLVLLGFSVLSASYPTWNPWTHPWIYDYLTAIW
jgi:hypothetical protein